MQTSNIVHFHQHFTLGNIRYLQRFRLDAISQVAHSIGSVGHAVIECIPVVPGREGLAEEFYKNRMVDGEHRAMTR